MIKEKGLWNVSFGEGGATLKALEDRGITSDHLKKIRSNENFADNVCNFVTDDCVLKGVFHRDVRKVMGKNIWGPEEWSHYYDREFSVEELKSASTLKWTNTSLQMKCPFSTPDKPKKICETHFLFWLPPSFKFIQEFYDYLNVHSQISTIEVRDEFNKLMNKEYESGWYLILLDECDVNFEEDVRNFIHPGYVPTEILLEITKQLLYKKLTGELYLNGISSYEVVNGVRFYLSRTLPPLTLNVYHELDWVRPGISVRKVTTV